MNGLACACTHTHTQHILTHVYIYTWTLHMDIYVMHTHWFSYTKHMLHSYKHVCMPKYIPLHVHTHANTQSKDIHHGSQTPAPLKHSATYILASAAYTLSPGTYARPLWHLRALTAAATHACCSQAQDLPLLLNMKLKLNGGEEEPRARGTQRWAFL